ncbi:hypothetical protein ACKRZS_007639 [Fusarium odoratissimum]
MLTIQKTPKIAPQRMEKNSVRPNDVAGNQRTKQIRPQRSPYGERKLGQRKQQDNVPEHGGESPHQKQGNRSGPKKGDVKGPLVRLDLRVPVSKQKSCYHDAHQSNDASRAKCPVQPLKSDHGSCSPGKGCSSDAGAGRADAVGHAPPLRKPLRQDGRARDDDEADPAPNKSPLSKIQMPCSGGKGSSYVTNAL